MTMTGGWGSWSTHNAVTQLCALAIGAYGVNKLVPLPHMDEIFHVPQTQTYCAGRWLEWDDKITTPPGLYAVGVLFGKFFGCDTQTLRLINLFSLVVGAWACSKLLRVQASFDYLTSFPLLFFFGLLYYTDVWSTLLVLSGLGLSLRGDHLGHHLASTAIFTLSLLFRQTNIVWAGFAALVAVTDNSTKGFFYQVKGAFGNWTKALPYTICAACFGGFLYWNKGITLGDKSNHQAGLNFCQMLYFCLFGTLFSGPQLAYTKRYAKRYTRGPTALARYCLELGLIYLVYTTQQAHPFVLADNRHYTFYLWRRLLTKPVVVPVYHYCIVWMLQTPFNLRVLGFWLALAAVLVPSPLLEPRYYMVGILVWRLVLSPRKVSQLELAWNQLISWWTAMVFCVSKTHFMW